MSQNQAQCAFSTQIQGDSLIQLKDGRILSYFFRSNYRIRIYDSKAYQRLFTINLYQPICKYEKDNGNIKGEYEPEKFDLADENENKGFYEYNFRKIIPSYEGAYEDEGETKNSIKELNNGKILVGYKNYLIEITLKEDSHESKVIYKINTAILDVNELPDTKIIVISKDKIKVLNNENGEYIVTKEYQIKDNWKIVPVSSKHRFYGKFHQYYSSELLPNNRLLLNSFSTELSYNGGCGTHPPQEFSHSKIIFINTENFEEIKITEEFRIDAKYIVLNDIIVIQAYVKLLIYDINSLELIKKRELIESNHYLYKYDDKYLVSISEEEKRNWINVYKVQDNDVVKYSQLNIKISFDEIIGWNGYSIQGYNNKFLLTLKDKRVLVICHKKMIVLNLNIE